jgi:hypothetical protein
MPSHSVHLGSHYENVSANHGSAKAKAKSKRVFQQNLNGFPSWPVLSLQLI